MTKTMTYFELRIAAAGLAGAVIATANPGSGGEVEIAERLQQSLNEQFPREAWFWDAASRTIYDENRLAVARDVNADDARRIILAMGGEPDFAIVGGEQPSPLWAILDDILAYEADKFDGDPDTDLNVSGADLVDAFTEWRTQLKAALDYSRPAHVMATMREAAAVFRDYAAQHKAKADASAAFDPRGQMDRLAKADRNTAMAAKIEAVLKDIPLA